MAELFRPWVWSVAWRDGRRGLKPLMLSLLCVVLGVASVVTAFSFRENLQSSIRTQSKSLLGADLMIESRGPFSAEDERLLASVGGEQSRQISFASMASFASGTRLVQVRAVRGGFPYYGALETEPKHAVAAFRGGSGALVDDNVLLQFNAQVGDRIKVGEKEFPIVGRLKKIPGETLAFSVISPRVYIPLDDLAATQLLREGALARHRAYFKLSETVDVDALVQQLSGRLQRQRLEAETVGRRMENIAASMENLSRYLRLAVFIAVLLAGVGIASGVHVYAKRQVPTIAVLRSLGAATKAAVMMCVVQVFSLTLVGALVGAAVGISLQSLLPVVLGDFLPVNTTIKVAPMGIVVGLAVGFGTAMLFSLFPLIPLRHVSPLVALRSSWDNPVRRHDPLLWLLTVMLLLGMVGFAIATTNSWQVGLSFTGGVVAVFGLLSALAKGLAIVVRRMITNFLPFAWRQGMANLHRPNNQTTVVLLAVGIGAFLLVTLQNTRELLIQQVATRGGDGEANLVLFDVQNDQRGAIAKLATTFPVRVFEEVPIVTMRLAAVKGRRVEEIRADKSAKIPRWALRRAYRSTYRANLTSTEKLVSGTWREKVNGDEQPVPVSVETGIADNLGVQLGDTLEFEIQGVPIETRVANLRQVDWQRVRPNFFVVFPAGVLESAPQFFAMVARADSGEGSASFQRALVERFPNVSAIDLTLILNTVNAILGRISFAVRFIALFTIITGFAVLAGAVLSGRSQRLRESILLRTLGASRRTILTTVVAEYLLLGAIAAMTGTLLAFAATWALSLYFFKTAVILALAPSVIIPIIIVAVTVAAGALGCWGIFRHSALATLRAEG